MLVLQLKLGVLLAAGEDRLSTYAFTFRIRNRVPNDSQAQQTSSIDS
jgi:hypothetical protein